MTNDDLDTVPWYRQFWPWFLIALPGAAVLGGLATVDIAIHHRVNMVVDDYYKEGLAINRVLDRDRKAKQLGVYAIGRFDPHTREVELRIKARDPLPPEGIQLRLMHPTLARLDVKVPMHYDATTHRYVARVNALSNADWYVQLEPPKGNWRLLGRMRLPGNGRLELGYPPKSSAG